ncbi:MULTISPECIES: SHOCT domain-containing protein [Clostridium]|jgi:putative membrane protein|uniref:SHOCT domain-containing protein n=2 Tax=Clostridium TaxID=1485 RepID=A0AAV3VXE1_9CLOT|nr:MULTISPECIES: SHOCT domain-containing protein [Clostridium]MBC2457420.1 SHOCT domain-containing protein [Clostridium beijerinckii]MBC2474436.1 SHOCT domain-containing protein [Clostridium beijerinckii]MCI1580266.1 SHOCT domain-containing protein [Clostridium beijerinckii]MCI1583178.1 SHOCT domain-containing protein [Clostridium beijerinckii]MCI1623324.1 SHOCT domain-containing protein [Clostridium beijerinckii]
MFCSGFGGYGGFGAASSIGYGGMFLAMGVRMLIFIALIVLAFKLFKNYTNKSNDAMKILNEKFAGGEITQEEYLKRKSVLSQKN